MLSTSPGCCVSFQRRAKSQGFTIVELLLAMAQITLIMSILSNAFVEGLETFRHLKAIGDLEERLRGVIIDSLKLRSDILEGREQTQGFIDTTRRTGAPDRAAAAALQPRYESIA